MKYTINLFSIITIAFAIWLGATGRVDWWVIAFVIVSHFEFNISWRDK